MTLVVEVTAVIINKRLMGILDIDIIIKIASLIMH